MSSAEAEWPKPVIKPGDIVKEKYIVVRTLGAGGFGAVFEVRDMKTKEPLALKMELVLPNENEAGLDLEVGVMKRIQRSDHAVRFVDNGKIDKLTFVVMELVGKDLAEIRRLCPDWCFTMSTSLRLGLQCFKGIEDMHKVGLLHRDIKPSNFALGRTLDDYRIVYVLDFGMVRRYRLKNGKVRRQRKVCGFRGTGKYASIACHKNQDLGRVDDLWSWLYMFVEFQNGGLPWQMESEKEKIFPIKEEYTYTKLYVGLEHENQRMAYSLLSLKYADKPQYKWYREQLNNWMQRKEVRMDDPYDWEPNGAYHAELKNLCPQPTERLMSKKIIKDRSESSTRSSSSRSSSSKSHSSKSHLSKSRSSRSRSTRSSSEKKDTRLQIAKEKPRRKKDTKNLPIS